MRSGQASGLGPGGTLPHLRHTDVTPSRVGLCGVRKPFTFWGCHGHVGFRTEEAMNGDSAVTQVLWLHAKVSIIDFVVGHLLALAMCLTVQEIREALR